MKAVILAAGEGSRIGEFTTKTNKCLIPIEGKSIIMHHIEKLGRIPRITEFIIVVGYKAKDIIETMGESWGGKKITYCYQSEKKEKGIISSIESAIDAINDDFVLVLGDEFVYNDYYEQAIEKFYELKLKCMVGIIEAENVEDIKKNYTFQIGEKGCLYNFVEKPDIPFNSYIGTGNIIFSKGVCELLSLVSVNPIRNERELVDLFELIIKEGNLIYPYIVGEAYFNINTYQDFERLERFHEIRKKRRENEK